MARHVLAIAVAALSFATSAMAQDVCTSTETCRLALRKDGADVASIVVAWCKASCEGEQASLLFYDRLRSARTEGALAIPGLLAIARDPAVPEARASSALWLIGALETRAASAEKDLIEVRAARPALALAVDETLVAIKSRESGRILGNVLRESRSWFTLVDISRTGEAAHEAGPEVVAMLGDSDPQARQMAAEALAAIGYVEGADDLIPLLSDPADVRLNFIAAQSLGKLRVESAIPALQDTARTHWYPPVRDAAAKALVQIRSNAPAVADEPGELVRLESGDAAMGEHLPVCEVFDVKEQKAPRGTKLIGEGDKAALAKLSYVGKIVGYGAVEPPLPAIDGEPEIERVSGTAGRHETFVDQVPGVALRVDGGWLLGTDRGEFVGELVFSGDDGVRQTLLDINVEDLYRIGDRIVATTGVAHMGINEGAVLDIRRGPEGKWVATHWRELPGAPDRSWAVRGGALLVDAYLGGGVLIDEDGTMRMAPCRKYEAPDRR